MDGSSAMLERSKADRLYSRYDPHCKKPHSSTAKNINNTLISEAGFNGDIQVCSASISTATTSGYGRPLMSSAPSFASANTTPSSVISTPFPPLITQVFFVPKRTSAICISVHPSPRSVPLRPARVTALSVPPPQPTMHSSCAKTTPKTL